MMQRYNAPIAVYECLRKKFERRCAFATTRSSMVALRVAVQKYGSQKSRIPFAGFR
jgi:hypothetical protein